VLDEASGVIEKHLLSPFWEAAQRRLRKELGEAGWTSMKRAVSQTTGAALAA